MRIFVTMIFGLVLAACSTTSPAPVAQQATQAGASATASVNAIRGQAGAPAITRNRVLDAVAKGHANDMAANNFFSHTGSNGSSAGQRAKKAGYKWCMISENVAKGYRDQAGAIESWRTSPGHYLNLVNRKSREFGMARTGNYWVMVLAAKRC